eukprot:2158566-Pleurochrysis_carterae.AAC.1
MATDLTENPSALRTGWKPLAPPAKKAHADGAGLKPAARGRGTTSRGRSAGRGSGRGRGALVDAFAGFGANVAAG